MIHALQHVRRFLRRSRLAIGPGKILLSRAIVRLQAQRRFQFCNGPGIIPLRVQNHPQRRVTLFNARRQLHHLAELRPRGLQVSPGIGRASGAKRRAGLLMVSLLRVCARTPRIRRAARRSPPGAIELKLIPITRRLR